MNAPTRNPGLSIDMPPNADDRLLVVDQSGALFEPDDTTINTPRKIHQQTQVPFGKVDPIALQARHVCHSVKARNGKWEKEALLQ